MTTIFSDSDIANIIKFYQSGESTKKIGKIFRTGDKPISRILRENGVILRPPGVKRCDIDTDQIIALYTSGKSVNFIAKHFGVDRGTIQRRLKKSRIIIRGQAEANQLSMSQRSRDENVRNTKAAHDAVRGKPRAHEELCKRAITRQKSFTAYGSPYEQDIADEFSRRQIQFTPQLAVDKYNIDFAIFDNIAFEVFGGNWHAKGRHRARFDERSKKLFSSGYTIVICWIGFNHRFSPSGIADYLVSLSEILRSDPSTRSKHYVIGGDGKPCSVGSSNLNYIT